MHRKSTYPRIQRILILVGAFIISAVQERCEAQTVQGLLAEYSTGTSTIEGPILHGWNKSCTSTSNNMYEGRCTLPTKSPVDWAWGSAFTVTWTGYVYAPVSGQYTFSGWQDGTVYLRINGNVLWDTNTTGGSVSGQVTLEGGTWYPFYMAFAANGGSNNLQLKWYHPGLGATELLPIEYLTPNSHWYVDVSNTSGPWDGLSWDTAFTSIQEAVDTALSGDEVWVATGTYHESITMIDGVEIYGGFSGMELQLDERDTTANPTVIDGTGAINTLVGSGTSSSSVPFQTSRAGFREQAIYLASEVGGATTITGLALNVVTPPSVTVNSWTIRMKHTSLSAYTAVVWETSGWTTVYQNNEDVTSTGWVWFNFTTPFVYNGTDNLMIDFSYNNSTTGTDGYCINTLPGTIRCIKGSCNTSCGDPLTWSGSTGSPYFMNSIPNLMLGATANHVVVMDGTTDTRVDGFTITGGDADGSSVESYGGGFLCSAADNTNTIANCRITGNQAVLGGGLYCNNGAAPQLLNCTIENNTSSSAGGAIRCFGASPTLVNCIFANNSASSSYGGGIACASSSPTIINSTFSGNTANTGGGIACYTGSNPIITNTIFEGNSLYGIYEADTSNDPEVTCCLFYNNTSGDYFDEGTTSYTGGSAINAIPDGIPELNVDGDPDFVNAGAGDFHIGQYSAAIDRGTDASAPSYDIDGQRRPTDVPGWGADGTNTEFDIGADEYYADADGDGLTDAEESALGTNSGIADTDGDGISDGDEVFIYGTEPLDSDSDNDEFSDGVELGLGTDPQLDTDYPSIADYECERMVPTLAQPWYFLEAQGLATDREGNVYLADTGHNRIVKYSFDGRLLGQWGRAGTGPGEFNEPYDVAVSHKGIVYVADRFNHRVQAFTSHGQFLDAWGAQSGGVPISGSGSGQFYEPQGIAVDNLGRIFVADTQNIRIQWLDESGTPLGSVNTALRPLDVALDAQRFMYVVEMGGSSVKHFEWNEGSGANVYYPAGEFGALDTPSFITVIADSVYVTDFYVSNIKKYDLDGSNPEVIIGSGSGDGEVLKPKGIAGVANGALYVADAFRVQQFTVAGKLRAVWESAGVRQGYFDKPNSTAVDSTGAVYVADRENKRIQKFDANVQFAKEAYLPSSGRPRAVAVSSTGYVYVADMDNNRILKYDSNLGYVDYWNVADSGSPISLATDSTGMVYVLAKIGFDAVIQKYDADGQLERTWEGGNGGLGFLSTDITVDSNGYVYVTERPFSNKRVQRFTKYGLFLNEWPIDSSMSPYGITVDSAGIVSVITSNTTTSYAARVYEFTTEGIPIREWGESGTGPGNFSIPTDITKASNGDIYIADEYNNRVQKLKPVTGGQIHKAIVLAGGGPYEGNNLWEITQGTANFAYRTLRHQGYSKSAIQYLSSDLSLDLDENGLLDDVDADATNANLQDAITNWAADADSLVLYCVDHGGVNTFRMSGTETLSASTLKGWLDTLQATMTGRVIVIIDACESGTQQSTLAPTSGEDRVIITSTSPDEPAYFLSTGTVSFSSFFWTQVFTGDDLRDAFNTAKLAIGQTLSIQNPLLNADADGIMNESVDDLDAVAGVFLGNGTDLTEDLPVIGSVSVPQTINGTNSAIIEAFDVIDPDGIARVWAVIRPPGLLAADTNNAIQKLPTLELARVESSNDFSADFSKFQLDGIYQVAIYAMDRALNVSAPAPTTVTVGAPRKIRGVILAGGSPNNSQWQAFENSYALAYEALRTQGFADQDLYLMAHTTPVPATVHQPNLGNLEYALGAWAGTDTQDLVLYLVGPAWDAVFQVNDTQTLGAATLDGWLDDLESRISGKLTVIVDTCGAGDFVPLLTPPEAGKRILLASTLSNEPARFLAEGAVSYSKFFWVRILNGSSVEEAHFHARNAMAFGGNGQEAVIEDDGNGIGNESSDGLLARYHFLGAGIGLAGDEPLIGSASGDQLLDGTTSALIWADNVTSTGTVDQVWAAITPPGYNSGTCGPVLPLFELTPQGGGLYEGTYNGFTKQGEYKVSIYAIDTRGNVSLAVESTVTQLTASDATPPAVSNFSPFQFASGVARQPVITFDIADSGSGVDSNLLTVFVNGVDVSGQLDVSGTPANLAVTYVPLSLFEFGEGVIVTVDAQDLDGNVMTTKLQSFTITNGIDTSPNDGMFDDWAINYGVTGNPGGDPDGDDLTNAEEDDLGYDPLVANQSSDLPDAFEEDDSWEESTWFGDGDPAQAHTFHDLADQDWFQFYAAEYQIYGFTVSSTGVDADPLVTLYGTDGQTPLDDDGGAGYMNWEATGTGFYFVRVSNTASAFGDDANYSFQIVNESGGFNIVADAGSNQTRNVGQLTTLNGSGSYDPDNVPTFGVDSYSWAFQSRPWGSSASLSNTTVVNPNFTPDLPGTYIIALEVSDSGGITDGDTMIVTVNTPPLGDERWVRFNAMGVMDGSSDNPYDTILQASIAVPAGGDIYIFGGSTSETPRLGEVPLDKPMHIFASDGIVRIGVEGETKSTVSYTRKDKQVSIGDMVSDLVFGMQFQADVLGPDNVIADSPDGVSARHDEYIYETAMPNIISQDGLLMAQPDSVLAVRLRGNSSVEPASLFVPIEAENAGEVIATWQPAEEGSTKDIWVLVRPSDRWLIEDVVRITTVGQDVEGNALSEREALFQVVEQPREDDSTFWQPRYGDDYDSDEINIDTETVPIISVHEEINAQHLREGMGGVYRVEPVEVYESPQRVWIPLPNGVDPAQVKLFYYHPHGEELGWYPAENVEGWLVPESQLLLEKDGSLYLGFLIRHAGIVQLGVMDPEN